MNNASYIYTEINRWNKGKIFIQDHKNNYKYKDTNYWQPPGKKNYTHFISCTKVKTYYYHLNRIQQGLFIYEKSMNNSYFCMFGFNAFSSLKFSTFNFIFMFLNFKPYFISTGNDIT